MDVIITLGHFCDTHGPCVILCTQSLGEIPETGCFPKNSVCSACKSIDSDTVYACEDDHKQFVSTRTALHESVNTLLKDVVLRSLSIETVIQDGQSAGSMYFGDNNRGHVIAHVFSIKDSFARGFRRKYCICIIGKHQISLLTHYDFIEKNLRKISEDLQQKAEKFNLTERSSSTGLEKVLRSLPELVGERNIFAHLHMWFVFLLRAEIYEHIPHNVQSCPVDCSFIKILRKLKLEMPADVFDTISYCILTGIRLEENNVDIVRYFQQLIPKGFKLPTIGNSCVISKTTNSWKTNFKETLPTDLPRLHIQITQALEDTTLPDLALQYHIMSFIMHWFSIACVLSWTPNPSTSLMRTLEVRNCDKCLLSYWIPQSSGCVEMCKTDYFNSGLIVDN